MEWFSDPTLLTSTALVLGGVGTWVITRVKNGVTKPLETYVERKTDDVLGNKNTPTKIKEKVDNQAVEHGLDTIKVVEQEPLDYVKVFDANMIEFWSQSKFVEVGS